MRKPVKISEGGPNWEHGIFDWMYEEEIFGRQSKAIWWSQSGDKIVYLSREKRNEKFVTLISYSNQENYPRVLELPYPKTHEKHLPTYVIKMWDKKLRTLKQMDVQLRDSTAFHYIYGVRWVKLKEKEQLVAVWANRLQNHISVTICDYDTAMCTLVFEYKYDTDKWAEPSDFSSILSDGDAIYMLFPKTQSDGNSYQQIAKLLVQMENEDDFEWAKLSYLSAGNFDVSKLEALDKATDTIYFTAAAPSPGNRHLFATSTISEKSDSWTCVSCLFKNCTYQTNLIEASFKRIITHCEGPAHSHYYLSNLKHNKLENVDRFLYSHDVMLEKQLRNTRLPTIINETVTLQNGFETRVQILLSSPSHQNLRSTSRTLPVLLKVYAGPTSQIVTDEFSIGFEEYIVSDRNYAVVKIDGRGSNSRGWKYRSAIYKVLGTVEIEDQIETLQILTKKYPVLDKKRLTIFGWSYGGFAAARAAEMAPPGFFKCAIAVAPVANFLYYDATYTERYMGNAEKAAYDSGDIITNVTNFKNTRLLLVHGLYDDNVQFQHSALLIEALQVAGIQFDLMVYPNQDHGILRRNHLYRKMVDFLDKCAQQ
ncbi:hypothetical protein KIN20_006374 [Parelaphostrongylus tenuis]|uniref:Dipeptidyl peptidase 4 n=1 Tax=Parelaphostrongylus tenuis TaxID=148309 RepID=A0AAD5QKZ1_PARTN|nr:hypothetical protein KIN20_006374 [Parelaphostrongylus tenuis]